MIIKPDVYQGIVSIPSSKSDAQRALLIAVLSDENTILSNYGDSKDELAMLENAKCLGKEIQVENKRVLVSENSISQISTDFNVSESGLGLRLMTALLSTKSFEVHITGEGSLLEREHLFYEAHLAEMGVLFSSNEGKLPFTVKGPLKAGNYTVDGSQSSQFISGLLIAFSQVKGTTFLTVSNLNSRPYVDMTLDTLKRFGIEVEETHKDVFKIIGKQTPRCEYYTIDGDWSSASCFLVASALGLAIKVDGLSMASKQADKQLVNALIHAGCRFENTNDGISFDGRQRHELLFDATDCPDLFPALVIYSALTPGIHKIKGIHRLANKESSRALTLQAEFKKMGVHIDLIEDEMIIHGCKQLHSANVSSHNDHRIAMALTVAAMVANIEISLEGSKAVSKSYPSFFTDVNGLKTKK